MTMMQMISHAFFIMLSAMVVENVVLARGLGISRVLMATDRRQTLTAGLSVTAVCTAAGLLHRPAVWLLRRWPAGHPVRVYGRDLVFLLVVCGAYLAVRLLFSRALPALFSREKGVFDRTAFNSAVLGTALLAASQRLDAASALAFYVGSGLGFLLAIIVVNAGYERLRFCNLPRAFRGLPVILLYIGILSMAIYGLIGHSLPA